MIYVRLMEYCEWEGETWYFYFQWDKNRELLGFLENVMPDGFSAREEALLDDTRDRLAKSEATTYMNQHNFVDGIVDIGKMRSACKDDESTHDTFYKGGILNFVIRDDIPGYATEATKCDKCGEYGPRPSIAVDGFVTVDDRLVLIKRLNEPFKDKWAFPGGYVNIGETVEEAVVREVKEETGIDTVVVEMIGVYSEPSRDPRNTISVAFVLKHTGGELKAGDDAKDVETFSMSELPELAFDHAVIVNDYLDMGMLFRL